MHRTYILQTTAFQELGSIRRCAVQINYKHPFESHEKKALRTRHMRSIINNRQLTIDNRSEHVVELPYLEAACFYLFVLLRSPRPKEFLVRNAHAGGTKVQRHQRAIKA